MHSLVDNLQAHIHVHQRVADHCNGSIQLVPLEGGHLGVNLSSSVLRMQATAALVPSLAALLLCASLHPAAAEAVTTEQLLFLEAWRAVDRAYVDKSFNGQSWFRVSQCNTASAVDGTVV